MGSGKLIAHQKSNSTSESFFFYVVIFALISSYRESIWPPPASRSKMATRQGTLYSQATPLGQSLGDLYSPGRVVRRWRGCLVEAGLMPERHVVEE